MTYKLALKLKKAGFIQRQWKYAFHYHPTEKNPIREPMIYLWESIEELGVKDTIYIPDLNELIEACMGFYYPSSFSMGGKSSWWAILRDESNTKALVPVQTGSTPEESVAKLWLALNKK